MTKNDDMEELSRIKAEGGVTILLSRQTAHIEALEAELAHARNDLQALRKRYEGSNEELETSNEELQSSNNEPSALDEESAHTNAKLVRCGNDLTNVEDSARLIVLLLARDLTVRRFSVHAQKRFGLTSGDIGCPVGQLRLGLRWSELEGVAAEVVDTLQSAEREVQDADGRWHSLRVSPYLTPDGQVDGAVVVLVDIEALKRGEQETSRIRDMAATITATMREALLFLDGEFNVTHANEAFYRDFQTTRSETQGRGLFEMGDGQWNIAPLRHALLETLPRNHTFDTLVVEHDFKGVGRRTLSLNARRLHDPRDRQSRILLAIDDITERTRSAQALVDSERRLRQIIDALPAAVYTSDSNGRVTHFNTACVALSGHTPRLGIDGWSDIWTLLHPDGTPVTPTEGPMAVALGAKGKPRHSEYIVQRPDGSQVWCEVYPSAQYDDDGRLRGGVNMLLDITHAREAAIALRQREERERALFEAAPMGLYVCDLNGIIQTYNEQAAKLWGREPKRGVDRHAGLVPLRDIKGQRVLYDDTSLSQVLSTGQPLDCVDLCIERPDGSLIPVMGSISPLKNADGEVTGVIASFVDITEHKEIEREFRNADRHKNEFIAMLAHELRNPLAPIRNALELIRPIIDTSPQPAAREAMSMLDRQVSQMLRLVDDMLDVNRMSTGRIELRRERIDLSAFVENDVQARQPTCIAKDQKLTVAVPSQPVFVDADPIRLSQVIGNLVHNASKFTEREGHIEVLVQGDGDDAVIRVKDTGIGLAPQELSRIFGLFAQVDASRRRSAGGLGIGLALVHDLVTLHGGTVTAHSEGPSFGASFVVRLKRADALPVESVEAFDAGVASPPVPNRVQRILVVDDNEDAAESLALLLEAKGYESRAVFDGFEGLAAVDAFAPDVVLLDIGMPKMDGLEVARRLRVKYPSGGLRIVALTGWGQDDDYARSAKAGFDAHLVKPVAFETLATWLKENT